MKCVVWEVSVVKGSGYVGRFYVEDFGKGVSPLSASYPCYVTTIIAVETTVYLVPCTRLTKLKFPHSS